MEELALSLSDLPGGDFTGWGLAGFVFASLDLSGAGLAAAFA
jgi:hypothetical protein